MPDTNDSEKEKRHTRNLGPQGYGDPNDRTLRKTEKNILIPQRRRQIVREEYCPSEIKLYETCVLKAGLLKAPYACKELKIKMADCLEFWNDNDVVQKRARDEYLQERSEFRQIGVSRQDRLFFEEFEASKKSQQKETN